MGLTESAPARAAPKEEVLTGPSFFFSETFPWESTTLCSIPQELRLHIYSYYHRKETPALKPKHGYGKPNKIKIHFADPDTGEPLDHHNLLYQDQISQQWSSQPHGIAHDSRSGMLFIADTKANRVQVFKRGCIYFKTLRSKSTFFIPTALTLDFEGNLLVCDSGANRVEIFTRETNYHSKKRFGSFGQGDGQLSEPYGITTDNDGNLVVSDYGNCRIQVFSPRGVWRRKFGTKGSGPGQLLYPVGVAVDPQEGSFLVVDRGNNRLQQFNRAGQSIRIIGEPGPGPCQFKEPWGVVVDKDGKILVTDRGNERIQLLSREGEFLVSIGNSNAMIALMLDSEGAIYATSSSNKILVFT